jgi:integrase
MSGRHQTGYIWKKGHAWYGRWYEDILVDGHVQRRPRARQLAPYNDRYRNVKDVRPILDDILKPINTGQSSPHGTMTVAAYYEQFFLPRAQAELKPSTVVGYKWIWKTYLSPRLQSAVMRDFQCVDATNLLADIYAEHGVSRKTLRLCKGLLSSVFSHAMQTQRLSIVHPIAKAAIPRKALKGNPTHATSESEAIAILNALDGISRTSVALIFFCGLRPGEARGARWEDYDGQRLQIRRSVWRTHIDVPKTEGSVAPVPVIEPLRSILNGQRGERGFILAGPSGKPINLSNLARRVIVPALQKKQIPWYGWYALRRGIATLATAVENTLAAKGLLRHTNVSTTSQFYVKDAPEETQSAMAKIEKRFRNAIKQPLSNRTTTAARKLHKTRSARSSAG